MENVKKILLIAKCDKFLMLTFKDNESMALKFKLDYFVSKGYDIRLYEVVGLSINLISFNSNSNSNGGF